MYVYYEEFSVSPGVISLVEIVLSSNGSSASIDWKRQSEKAQFEIINAYLKSVSADKRSYDATSHIWSYVGSTGVAVIQAIQAGINGGLLNSTTLVKITDLQNQTASGRLNFVAKSKSKPAKEVEIKFSEEDFFYTPEPQSKALSKDELLKRLTALLDTSPEPFIQLEKTDPTAAKKLYRRAALKLHPDRNNGDGSKMSELNMLWTMYTA